jgi:AraC-like DNA-binding protein
VSLFQSFLFLICKSFSQLTDDDRIQPSELGELVGWITKHCEKDWSVEKMCKACRKSRPTLFREFKKFYGIAPLQFLTNQRMHKACALLKESNMSMEEISNACGFESSTYFSTIFKKNMKTTPLNYRKNAKKQHPYQATDCSCCFIFYLQHDSFTGELVPIFFHLAHPSYKIKRHLQ